MKDKSLLENLTVLELKIINGDHMLAQLMEDTEEYITICNPVLVKEGTIQTEDGMVKDYRYYIHYMPMSIENDFVLYKDHIVMNGTVDSESKNVYFDMIINTPKGVHPTDVDLDDNIESDLDYNLESDNPTYH